MDTNYRSAKKSASSEKLVNLSKTGWQVFKTEWWYMRFLLNSFSNLVFGWTHWNIWLILSCSSIICQIWSSLCTNHDPSDQPKDWAQSPRLLTRDIQNIWGGKIQNLNKSEYLKTTTLTTPWQLGGISDPGKCFQRHPGCWQCEHTWNEVQLMFLKNAKNSRWWT